jgi:LDH2 family malate/lactate/ureidoglycolate dehydrogenase
MPTQSPQDPVHYDFDTVERFMVDVFMGYGLPEKDARISAEILITADKRGIDSHGVGRLKPIYVDRIKAGQISPITKIDVIKEGPTTAVLDANNGMGQVVSALANDMAIAKAKKFGMGMVTVRNSNHYGIAGYYTCKAAEAGCVGFSGTNARPSIAPTFGVENMLGTNPMTWAMPTDEAFPFSIDCATSVTQRGKIEVYARQGKDLPPGWVIGQDGGTKTDSAAVLDELVKGTAALAPVGGLGEDGGGYKGYDWATVIEILSSALQQGAFLKGLLGFDAAGKRQPYRLGHFFMAIDIEAFTDLPSFRKTAGDICRALRASKKAPGQERIWTAGEKEWDAWLERKDKGVPFDAVVRAEFDQLKADLGLSGYRFPWEK